MNWLFSLSTINGIAGLLACTALLYMRRIRSSPAWIPMLLWFGHAALFWFVVSIARLGFSYAGVSQIASLWSSVIYLQAFITVIANAVIEMALREAADGDR